MGQLCSSGGYPTATGKKKTQKTSLYITESPNTNWMIRLNKDMTVLLAGRRGPAFNCGIWFRLMINASIWGLNGFTYNQASLQYITKSLSAGELSSCLCNWMAVAEPLCDWILMISKPSAPSSRTSPSRAAHSMMKWLLSRIFIWITFVLQLYYLFYSPFF